MNRCITFLVSLLAPALAPSRLLAAPSQNQPAQSAAVTDAGKAEMTDRLKHVYQWFVLDNFTLNPHPAWLNARDRFAFEVLPATPEALRQADFALVRPEAESHDEFYVARVFAKDDPKKKALYVYLLRMRLGRADIVRAFVIDHGKAQKIVG